MSVLASVTTHRELVENLVQRDIKARYKQSVLGYAWAVLNPLVLTLVYYLVGGVIFRLAQGSFPFAVHVCFGLLYWNLFSTGLSTATEGLVSHLSLITKVYFPREVFPISAVLSKLVDFGFGLIGFIPLLLIFRIAPSISILWTIPLLVIQLLFTMGLGLLTSCANLFYRDVRYLVQLTLGIWLYLVPNLYTMERVAQYPLLYKLYLLNPMAVFIEASRRAAFPQTGDLGSLAPYLGITTLVSIATFILGYVVFKRFEDRFAEFV